jgi:Spy/CpxP family protein refolding chaperone
MYVEQASSFGGPPEDGPGVNVERRVTRMSEVLGLSDAQKEQITALLKTEQEKNAPLREQLAANRKQLKQAALAATFDEATVQSIAAIQAQIISQLIVSHARTKSQINALLTPEQRSQAEKMGPKNKRFHRRPGGPGGDF